MTTEQSIALFRGDISQIELNYQLIRTKQTREDQEFLRTTAHQMLRDLEKETHDLLALVRRVVIELNNIIYSRIPDEEKEKKLLWIQCSSCKGWMHQVKDKPIMYYDSAYCSPECRRY